MSTYIGQADYNYFEQLLNGLGEADQRNFLAHLKQAASDLAGSDVTMIRVVDECIPDKQGIDPQEIISRVIIDKAYKATKEGN